MVCINLFLLLLVVIWYPSFSYIAAGQEEQHEAAIVVANGATGMMEKKSTPVCVRANNNVHNTAWSG
jgi:hypothetical protein